MRHGLRAKDIIQQICLGGQAAGREKNPGNRMLGGCRGLRHPREWRNERTLLGYHEFHLTVLRVLMVVSPRLPLGGIGPAFSWFDVWSGG